ncbi:MAG: hypothetical protein GY854_30655 [Deltaproteobacteria bacterium]|nr:hypothetical protein [Deltaproteobacteria bacterium]
MREIFIYSVFFVALSYSSLAIAVDFYYIAPEYVKVERTTGCGANPLVWYDSTTNFIDLGTHRHAFGYDLTRTNVDGIRIKYETNLCQYDGCGDYCWDNWRFRKHNGTSWVWDSSCDYEGYFGWNYDQYGQFQCHYRMQERNEICNRTYESSSGHPRVAYTNMQGYDIQDDFWVSRSIYFFSPD